MSEQATHTGTAVGTPDINDERLTPSAVPTPDMHGPAANVGRWIHRHPRFMHEPVTFMGYELFRSSMATIPYGFMMALGHHVFGFMGREGARNGLTQKGFQEYTKGGIAAVKDADQLFEKGTKALAARTAMRIGHSPMNQAVQIALGFTLFRFVGGIIKNLHDRVDNPKNTEEDSAREAGNWKHTIKETMKINWKAESTSTPIAALVLGFIGANWVIPKHVTDNIVRNKSVRWIDQAKELTLNPKGKLLQQGAIWTFSYSLFFLLAECLFKDVQIRRGLWKGHPNSLKNGPDDIVGGPAAVTFDPPERRALQAEKMISETAENGYMRKSVSEHDIATDTDSSLKYPALTREPSIGRFWLRRVAPVAVGITGYAFAKRLGYMTPVPILDKIAGAEFTSGMMKPIDESVKGITHLKRYMGNTFREGKATATFGVLWAAVDVGTGWYDKFFSNLQGKPKAPAAELNSHQQQNQAALLGKLNEKDLASTRVA